MIRKNHDELLTNHKKFNVTWTKISKKYFFSKMRKKIKKYIKRCDICNKTKKLRQAEISIQSLKILSKSWKLIIMNFIDELSESMNSVLKQTYENILIIINRFFKTRRFISIKRKQSAEDLTHLIIKEIMIKEKVSKLIIFNKDKLFVLKFWINLMTKLKIKKKMSTVFHSQTNEQTKRFN